MSSISATLPFPITPIVCISEPLQHQLKDCIISLFGKRFEEVVHTTRLEDITCATYLADDMALKHMGFLMELPFIDHPKSNKFLASIHCNLNWNGIVVWQHFLFRRKHTARGTSFFHFEIACDGEQLHINLMGNWDDAKAKEVLNFLLMLKLSHHEALAHK